jgi:hypothetical protein
MVPPTATLGDAWVVRPAPNLLTVTSSLGSEHAVGPAGLLLASPPYETLQRYSPAWVVWKWSEGYGPLPLTAFVDVTAGGPAHEASSGPKRVNVSSPVGLDPPRRLAVSEISNPTVVLITVVDVIVGLLNADARVTTASE